MARFHLLGQDHETGDADATAMEALETEALHGLRYRRTHMPSEWRFRPQFQIRET